MCGPAAIPIAVGMQAAGGLYSAYQQKQAGKSEKAYNNFLADTAERNAQASLDAADRQITNVQTKAAFDDSTLHDQVKSVEGSQKVALAANGVGAGSVTAEDITLDTMSKAAKDEALIRYNADSTSSEILKGAKIDAANLRMQAAGYRIAGKKAQKAANIGAFTTLLSTAAQSTSTLARK